MSGTISFPGISGEQNFGQIIDALVAARRNARVQPLQEWKTEWETKIDAVSSIDSTLSSFYSAIKGMDRTSQFLVRSASSSNETVLTASADSSAHTGSYEVEVGTNIPHMLGSQGVDQGTYSMDSTETWTIDVGSNSFNVNVAAGDTLAQVCSKIETADDAAGDFLSAEVIDDGSSNNPNRLVLTANSGGSSNEIQVSNNTSNLYFSTRDTSQLLDSPELCTGWSGSGTVSSGGTYEGTTNKTFRFAVSGDGTYTIGTDEFDVAWTDGEGNSGTVSVTASDYTNLDVFQGVTVSFGSPGDTIAGGDTLSLDVWHPDMQAAQDTGLAKAEREVHSGFSDTDTTAVTATDQTFSYTYNGRETSITVAAGTTLSELKDLINNDGENPGVTASITNDGSGLPTAYHLVLSGDQTGAAYKITDITHSLDNFDTSFTESQSGQNAMLKVDNYPSASEYFQNSTNHITEVIEGVSLELHDTGTSTVTVGTDTSAMVEKVQGFREAFNNVRSAIQEATSYNAETGESGTLIGNYAVQIIKSRLDNMVTGAAPGFQDPDDTYVNLQQLGFSTDTQEGSDTEGLLMLDTSVLNQALDEDPEAVAEVFASYLDGTTDSTKITFESSLDTATAGIYDVEVDTTAGSEQGRFRLEDGDWGEWVDLSGSSGDYYLTGNSGPEKGISLHITHSQDSGTHSAQARLKNGVLAQLSGEMEDILSSEGPLNNITEHYNDIIDSVEDRIAAEERRLENYEEMLTQRFARLDAYMSKMTGLSNSLSNMASQLPGSK